MQIKFVRLSPNAEPPTRGTPGAAGLDLCACLSEPVVIEPGKAETIPLGFAAEIPSGYGGFVLSRSGIGSRGIVVAQGVGLIDSDYRGELQVPLTNHSDTPFEIQPGDRIVKMNNAGIRVYREVSTYMMTNRGETVELVYEREGERHTASLVPRQGSDGSYYLGLRGSGVRMKGNLLQIIGYSAYEVKYWISTTIKSLGMLFGGRVKADDVSGPVGIVNTIGETYESSRTDGAFYVWLNMLYISILLTANLGVMNLLPIPALDGGRLVFLLLEAVRGKGIDPEKEGMVHFVGLMVLMVFMVLVMFNDVRHILM